MTESAVERLTEKSKEQEWDWVDVHPFDLRDLLSERAELLATVERMREELNVAREMKKPQWWTVLSGLYGFVFGSMFGLCAGLLTLWLAGAI